MKGKRYQRKRNHYNRFRILYPDCAVQPISQDNLPAVKQIMLRGLKPSGRRIRIWMAEDIFDVHFEKAHLNAECAYTAINCEFAKHIRDQYPQIRFLNREEVMGLEGLRKQRKAICPITW